jgi:hypothetical protein
VLQRERLEQAPLSKEARMLIREVETASPAKLRYLSWAFYRNNQPTNLVHRLSTQSRVRVWEALRTRKEAAAEKAASFVMALYLYTRCEALVDLIRLSIHYRSSRLSRKSTLIRSSAK